MPVHPRLMKLGPVVLIVSVTSSTRVPPGPPENPWISTCNPFLHQAVRKRLFTVKVEGDGTPSSARSPNPLKAMLFGLTVPFAAPLGPKNRVKSGVFNNQVALGIGRRPLGRALTMTSSSRSCAS